MALIIVDSVELQSIAANVEMYAEILDDTDEDDIETVYGYAEQFKQAAAELRDLVEYAAELRDVAGLAKPAKGEEHNGKTED